MPVVIVNEHTDLAGLSDRLLRANSSAATREAAVRALREANPGIDPDDLRPGTAVVVPTLRGGLSRIDDVVEPGIADATARVDRDLAGLAEAFAAAGDHAAATHERTAAALADPAVKRAVRGNDARKAVVAELKERAAKEEAAAARRQELAAEATAAWTEDLAGLRQLWSDED